MLFWDWWHIWKVGRVLVQMLSQNSSHGSCWANAKWWMNEWLNKWHQHLILSHIFYFWPLSSSEMPFHWLPSQAFGSNHLASRGGMQKWRSFREPFKHLHTCVKKHSSSCKQYDSIAFSIFAILYNACHYLIPLYHIIPQRKPISPWQPLICLLCL